MRPFTDRVEVPILNLGLAGGSDPRANKYPRPTGGGGKKPEGVTISAMFGHPYPLPGEEISRRVEHDFLSL
ncbi:hypothetical protein Taro_020816 [Colocasia esculenta]|uniref:Uncharacterized protein n=1 Tax=Colocasia esculenta TaxID=4460 RepID=A0A843UZS6_COLES|nr:hypothetical protein [Colocasia esculenta]